eukprot:gene7640-biopygen14282
MEFTGDRGGVHSEYVKIATGEEVHQQGEQLPPLWDLNDAIAARGERDELLELQQLAMDAVVCTVALQIRYCYGV